MTLLSESKSNSMIAKYNGDKLDIVAENDDGHSKNIYITQLSMDDVKDLIARRSNEKPLEERLKSDYRCRYNFGRPTRHQHRGYGKGLLQSLKDMDMIMSTPIIKKAGTKRRKKKRARKTRARSGSRSKARSRRRFPLSKSKRTKTVKYNPYGTRTRRMKKSAPLAGDNIVKDKEVADLEKNIPDYSRRILEDASHDHE